MKSSAALNADDVDRRYRKRNVRVRRDREYEEMERDVHKGDVRMHNHQYKPCIKLITLATVLTVNVTTSVHPPNLSFFKK